MKRDPEPQILHVPWYEWKDHKTRENRAEYIAHVLQAGAGLSLEEAATVPGGVMMSHRTDGDDVGDRGGGVTTSPHSLTCSLAYFFPLDVM